MYKLEIIDGENPLIKFKKEIGSTQDLRVVVELTYEFKVSKKLMTIDEIDKWFKTEGIKIVDEIFETISKEEVVKNSNEFNFFQIDISDRGQKWCFKK